MTAHAIETSPPSLENTDEVFDQVPVAKPRWMHYGDAIRILGTVAVVIGHVASLTVFSETPLSKNWWVCNVWDAATRWAVPVYIMLSGSLLLDPARAEIPGVFYRKRMMRIGVPLIFWSIFFMWFSVYYTGWVHDPAPAYFQGFLIPPRQMWINLLKGQPYVHLHFIFRIAGLYAFTPAIRVFLRHSDRRMQVTTVAIMLGFSCADSLANSITGVELSAFARFVPFLGYYIAGYLLRDTLVRGKWWAMCWAGWIGAVTVLAGCSGLFVSLTPGHVITSANQIFFEFLSPVRIVMGLSAWLILVRLFHKPWPATERGRWWLRAYADTTLGLYLIHPMFREFFYLGMKVGLHADGYRLLSHGLSGEWPNIWIGVPLVSLIVYVPSWVATIILMRIPFVRRIMG